MTDSEQRAQDAADNLAIISSKSELIPIGARFADIQRGRIRQHEDDLRCRIIADTLIIISTTLIK